MSRLVLSLWQPWATLCVAHDPDGRVPKSIETRSWSPSVPTPFEIAIHATLKCDREILNAIDDGPFKSALSRCGYFAGDPRPFVKRKLTPPGGQKLLPLGAIVGVARVVLVLPTTEMKSEISAENRAFGNFAPGRFAWLLDNAHELPRPIPYTGCRLALYALNEAIDQSIDLQLNDVRLQEAAV